MYLLKVQFVPWQHEKTDISLFAWLLFLCIVHQFTSIYMHCLPWSRSISACSPVGNNSEVSAVIRYVAHWWPWGRLLYGWAWCPLAGEAALEAAEHFFFCAHQLRCVWTVDAMAVALDYSMFLHLCLAHTSDVPQEIASSQVRVSDRRHRTTPSPPGCWCSSCFDSWDSFFLYRKNRNHHVFSRVSSLSSVIE